MCPPKLKAWLGAVLRHWVQGLIGSLLIGAMALYSELSGKTISPHIYELAGGLLLLYATFLAWSDESSQKLAAQQRVCGT